ncbi:hypothetical protein [Salipaludibacillus daqingensis]|uniref:hypothetical protein n=1 Tax=Salipaludibacillus daqingensis TaxID=3041001 RepID=UPI002473CAE9|nr:hypothetical protein [Salipaludibacillus daqingensis]
MQWLFLFTGIIMGAISIYHLFTDKHRKSSNDYTIYKLDDPKKIQTGSRPYKLSIIAAYLVLFLTIFLYIEVFNNIFNATILFFVVLILGAYVLITIDRIFEIHGEAIIFAGYHARWGKIRSIAWGKKRKDRTQLIMILAKNQKIKTTIANERVEELEEILSNYVHFEK